MLSRTTRTLIALSLYSTLTACTGEDDTSTTGAGSLGGAEFLGLEARVDGTPTETVPEHSTTFELVASWNGTPRRTSWRQVGGPSTSFKDLGHHGARIDLSNVDVAAPVELSFELTSSDLDAPVPISVVLVPVDIVPAMGPATQLGGATGAVASFEDTGARYIVYTVGNRVSVTPTGMARGPDYAIRLPDYVHEIVIVDYEAKRYGLAAMGSAGLAVLDLTLPTTPILIDTVALDYFQDGITFTEGGGDIVPDQEIASDQAKLACLATDGTTLWLGTSDYGLHKTALANLLGATGISRDLNGTLAMDSEVFTLQYAGENPWGGPEDIQVVGDRLFVAQGFLGLGIFDATTLERVGGYNLYTDASVVEDWFIDMDVATQVHGDATGPFLDAVTGLPDYRQANFEIEQVWHGGVDAPTPWAEFDRYARYYYVARSVDVATQGTREIAYLASGLAGLVAVDVTGAGGASTGAPLTPTYLGYVPAVPAHGPNKPTGGTTESLFPHYGAGKLVEAGVTSVVVSGDQAWFADHFAGLVVVGGADNPQAHWHGPNGLGNYDNDNPNLGGGILGDHWPDYEFVTSYDMTPSDPLDDESLPVFLFESPVLVTTGEVVGHGGDPLLEPGLDTSTAGAVDVIQAAGSGGMVTLDIVDLSAAANDDRFSLVAWYPTTDELGAAADGTVTEPMSIGHTQGVSASARYLYVGDGPHGVSAWLIADPHGNPVNQLRLVGNTVQDEYPVTVGDTVVYPATHASTVVFDSASQSVLSLSQSLGLRRVPVADIEAGVGVPGAPILLAPALTDIFEHNTEAGNTGGIRGQDHAYDAIVDGNLAFVADGSNGLTVYDLTKDPSSQGSGFVAGNLGGGDNARPPLGRATGIDLWTDHSGHTRYAFVAAGQRGIGVVDATDPAAMTYIKVFEPIKLEDDTAGKADGRCVDLRVIGDTVWASYSSFGLVSYKVSDLIAPLPANVDPLEIWDSSAGFDYRPTALDRLDLTDIAGYENASYEFLYLDHTEMRGEVRLYLASGGVGLTIVDGTNPSDIRLLHTAKTVHEASAVAIANGRVYVADASGGVAAFK